MVPFVRSVKVVVSGQYFGFHISFQPAVHHWVHHLLERLAWRTVAHINHSAAGVSVPLDYMQHNMVVQMCVHPYRCTLPFSPLKHALGYPVHSSRTCQPVYRAVGRCIVKPLPLFYIGICGLWSPQQCKITHHPSFLSFVRVGFDNRMTNAMRYVALYQVCPRIATPL